MKKNKFKVLKNTYSTLLLSSLLLVSQGCGSSGASSTSAEITASSVAMNELPESENIELKEGETDKIQLFDIENSSLRYKIIGKDSHLFSINEKTGILKLKTISNKNQNHTLILKTLKSYSFSVVITSIVTTVTKTIPILLKIVTLPTSAINTPPTANAGVDKTVQVNQSVSLVGTGSDTDGTVSSYEWSKNGTTLGTTATYAYTPTTVGTDTLTFTVTDDDGASTTDTVDITVTAVPVVVANVPPTANAGVDKTVQVNQSVSLVGTGSDTDGTVSSYEWSKNGTTLGTTATYAYTPTTVGTDTLTFTVTDDDGLTDSDTMDVNVTTLPVVPTTVGLRGHWEFEGDLRDTDPIHTTLLPSTGTFTYTNNTNGAIGKSLKFDGVTNSLDFSRLNYILSRPGGWTLHNDFTLSYFVKSDMAANYDHFSKDIGCALPNSLHITSSSSAIRLSTDNSAMSSMSPNTWTLITIVKHKGYDLIFPGGQLAGWIPAQYKLYKNGVDQNTSTSSSEIFDGDIAFSKGCVTNGVVKFKGELDDVRFYNRALSPSEIGVIYNQL